MLKTIQTIRLILSLLPLILDTIRAIEAALPAGGLGREKLALVRTTIESAYIAAGEAADSFETIWPALERTIGAAVALFNRTGLFSNE